MEHSITQLLDAADACRAIGDESLAHALEEQASELRAGGM